MNNIIYDITKEYNAMYRIIIYKHGLDPMKLSNKNKNKIINILKKEVQKLESVERSVRRSRTVINDYVLCNDFDLFVTFTFDPKKTNRYDLDVVYFKMSTWLRRQSSLYPDFKYIIVPEKHKDGAIHFHALINGYTGKLKKTNVIQNNKRVYNLTGFRLGFTNAQYLDEDKQKAIAYLCKYITKDMALVSSRRRYWCSKTLRKPIVHRNNIFDLGLSVKLNYKTQVYETDYNVIHHVNKEIFE